jgi:hypothetical protein
LIRPEEILPTCEFHRESRVLMGDRVVALLLILRLGQWTPLDLRGERVGVAPPNSLQPTCHHGCLRSTVEIAELAPMLAGKSD